MGKPSEEHTSHMKKILKKLLDIFLLLLCALGILAIVAGIIYYIITADLRELERKNKEDPVYQKVMAELAEKEKAEKERQEKLDKLDEQKQEERKAIADFEKKIKGKYTKDYLLKKISSDKKMAEHLYQIAGYDTMNYWYTSHNLEDELCYDELSYYVFKDEKSAKAAFDSMKEEWIETETDSGKNYVQGWERGVLDASLEIFIYQTDNMIITTELQVVSEWAEPEDGEADNSSVGYYYRKDFIKKYF